METLAPKDGWAHVGPSGAGHFVKMVHNGIEYGLMQAYAEGFEVLNASEFGLDLEEIAGIWRYGSVVRSWLLELLHDAFDQHGSDLKDIAGYVDDSGEGRWTVFEAINEDVPVPVISAALYRPLRLAPGRVVRGEDRRRAPPAVRRPRRQVGDMTKSDSPSARHRDTPRRSCRLHGRLQRAGRRVPLPTRPWPALDMAAMTETQVQRIRCSRGSGIDARLSLACSSSSAPRAT